MKTSIKNLFILSFFLVIAQLSYAQSSQIETVVIKTSIHCDHCKACETCGESFESKIMRIKGLKSYELDEKNETITVIYNTNKTSLSVVRNTISKLGYDADDVKADPEAYKKLDGCCKKS